MAVLWTDDAEAMYATAKGIELDSLAAQHGDEARAYFLAIEEYRDGKPAALAAFADGCDDTYGDGVVDAEIALNLIRQRAEQIALLESEGAAVASVYADHVRAAAIQGTLKGKREIEAFLNSWMRLRPTQENGDGKEG